MRLAETSIHTVKKDEDKLIQFQENKEGLKICVFENRKAQFESDPNINISETLIKSYDQISHLKQYFDTLENFSQYVKRSQNIKIKQNILQIFSKHPIKQNQSLKIGQLTLNDKSYLEQNDFDYISQICMSQRQIQNKEIKSILLRFNIELQQRRKQQKKRKCREDILEQKVLQIEKDEKKDTKQFAKFQEELEILSKIFSKKLQIMSSEVQNNKKIIQQKLSQSLKIFQSLDSICQFHVQSKNQPIQTQLRQLNQRIQADNTRTRQKIQQNERKLLNQINQTREMIQKIINQDKKNKKQGKRAKTQKIEEQMQQINESMFQQKEQNNQLTKIEDIEPGSQHINIQAKIIKVGPIRDRRILISLGDETAIVNASFPALSFIKQGNTIVVLNCLAYVNEEQIQLRLPRRNGLILQSTTHVQKVNTNLNISDKLWVPI